MTDPHNITFIRPSIRTMVESGSDSLYHFKCYTGTQDIELEQGDSCYLISPENHQVELHRGRKTLHTKTCATVIRGYAPPESTQSLAGDTTLPYINGCSVKQLFTPQRSGDPTLQYLLIPPHTSEQAHHVHSTYRVAYILKGSGKCISGTPTKPKTTYLEAGMICILPPMSAHHFTTEEEALHVIPLHIFSTTGSQEFQHPMFLGTQPV